MRLLTLIACCTMVYCHESKNPLKIKKYKCIEIPDDVDIQLVPKRTGNSGQPEEEFRSIGSAHIGPQQPEEDIETPQAHKMLSRKGNDGHSRHITPTKVQEAPRDKEGRPLLLSPSHCKQVKHYAMSYGVSDVVAWVGRNCSFAKMFLPTATCEEINALVASCYKNKYP